MPVFTTTTPSQRRLIILGVICWIAGLEFFAAEAVAAAGWAGYSYAAFDISFLGATNCAPVAGAPGVDAVGGDVAAVAKASKDAAEMCSPRHAWMNGGLVVLGLLHLTGLVLTWPAWPRSWGTVIGRAALAAAAAGAVLVGLAPVTGPASLHHAGAGVSLVLGNLGMALMGLALLRRGPAFSAFSMSLGVLGLAGLALYRSHVYLGLGRGTVERIAAYPQTVWYAVAGVVLLVAVLRARPPHPTLD